MVMICLIGWGIASPAFGDCPKSVFLEKGTTVTDCDRVGLSVEHSKTLKKQLIDADYTKKELEGHKQLLNLREQMVENLKNDVKLYNEERLRAYAERDRQAARNQTVFWVGMGVGISIPIIAAIIIQKVVK